MSREYFTPGPWKEDHLGRLVGSNGEQVDIWGLGCAHASRSPKSEANASVMRTSSELYELAKAALEWIDEVPSDTPLPTMPGFDRDWADSVMAKARGELND